MTARTIPVNRQLFSIHKQFPQKLLSLVAHLMACKKKKWTPTFTTALPTELLTSEAIYPLGPPTPICASCCFIETPPS